MDVMSLRYVSFLSHLSYDTVSRHEALDTILHFKIKSNTILDNFKA